MEMDTSPPYVSDPRKLPVISPTRQDMMYFIKKLKILSDAVRDSESFINAFIAVCTIKEKFQEFTKIIYDQNRSVQMHAIQRWMFDILADIGYAVMHEENKENSPISKWLETLGPLNIHLSLSNDNRLLAKVNNDAPSYHETTGMPPWQVILSGKPGGVYGDYVSMYSGLLGIIDKHENDITQKKNEFVTMITNELFESIPSNNVGKVRQFISLCVLFFLRRMGVEKIHTNASGGPEADKYSEWLEMLKKHTPVISMDTEPASRGGTVETEITETIKIESLTKDFSSMLQKAVQQRIEEIRKTELTGFQGRINTLEQQKKDIQADKKEKEKLLPQFMKEIIQQIIDVSNATAKDIGHERFNKNESEYINLGQVLINEIEDDGNIPPKQTELYKGKILEIIQYYVVRSNTFRQLALEEGHSAHNFTEDQKRGLLESFIQQTHSLFEDIWSQYIEDDTVIHEKFLISFINKKNKIIRDVSEKLGRMLATYLSIGGKLIDWDDGELVISKLIIKDFVGNEQYLLRIFGIVCMLIERIQSVRMLFASGIPPGINRDKLRAISEFKKQWQGNISADKFKALLSSGKSPGQYNYQNIKEHFNPLWAPDDGMMDEWKKLIGLIQHEDDFENAIKNLTNSFVSAQHTAKRIYDHSFNITEVLDIKKIQSVISAGDTKKKEKKGKKEKKKKKASDKKIRASISAYSRILPSENPQRIAAKSKSGGTDIKWNTERVIDLKNKLKSFMSEFANPYAKKSGYLSKLGGDSIVDALQAFVDNCIDDKAAEELEKKKQQNSDLDTKNKELAKTIEQLRKDIIESTDREKKAKEQFEEANKELTEYKKKFDPSQDTGKSLNVAYSIIERYKSQHGLDAIGLHGETHADVRQLLKKANIIEDAIHENGTLKRLLKEAQKQNSNLQTTLKTIHEIIVEKTEMIPLGADNLSKFSAYVSPAFIKTEDWITKIATSDSKKISKILRRFFETYTKRYKEIDHKAKFYENMYMKSESQKVKLDMDMEKCRSYLKILFEVFKKGADIDGFSTSINGSILEHAFPLESLDGTKIKPNNLLLHFKNVYEKFLKGASFVRNELGTITQQSNLVPKEPASAQSGITISINSGANGNMISININGNFITMEGAANQKTILEAYIKNPSTAEPETAAKLTEKQRNFLAIYLFVYNSERRISKDETKITQNLKDLLKNRELDQNQFNVHGKYNSAIYYSVFSSVNNILNKYTEKPNKQLDILAKDGKITGKISEMIIVHAIHHSDLYDDYINGFNVGKVNVNSHEYASLFVLTALARIFQLGIRILYTERDRNDLYIRPNQTNVMIPVIYDTGSNTFSPVNLTPDSGTVFSDPCEIHPLESPQNMVIASLDEIISKDKNGIIHYIDGLIEKIKGVQHQVPPSHQPSNPPSGGNVNIIINVNTTGPGNQSGGVGSQDNVPDTVIKTLSDFSLQMLNKVSDSTPSGTTDTGEIEKMRLALERCNEEKQKLEEELNKMRLELKNMENFYKEYIQVLQSEKESLKQQQEKKSASSSGSHGPPGHSDNDDSDDDQSKMVVDLAGEMLPVLQKENDNLREELQSRETLVKALQEELEKAKSKAQQIEELNRKIAPQLEQLSNIKNGELKQKDKKIESLEQLLHRIEQELKTKTTELQNRNEQIDNLTKQNSLLDAQMNTLKSATNDTTKKSMEELKQEYERQLQKLNEEKSEIQKTLSEVKTALEKTEKEKQELLEKIDGQEQQIKHNESLIKALQEGLSKNKLESEASLTEAEKTYTDIIKQKVTQITSIERQNEELSEELEKIKKEKERLKQEIQKLMEEQRIYLEIENQKRLADEIIKEYRSLLDNLGSLVVKPVYGELNILSDNLDAQIQDLQKKEYPKINTEHVGVIVKFADIIGHYRSTLRERENKLQQLQQQLENQQQTEETLKQKESEQQQIIYQLNQKIQSQQQETQDYAEKLQRQQQTETSLQEQLQQQQQLADQQQQTIKELQQLQQQQQQLQQQQQQQLQQQQLQQQQQQQQQQYPQTHSNASIPQEMMKLYDVVKEKTGIVMPLSAVQNLNIEHIYNQIVTSFTTIFESYQLFRKRSSELEDVLKSLHESVIYAANLLLLNDSRDVGLGYNMSDTKSIISILVDRILRVKEIYTKLVDERMRYFEYIKQLNTQGKMVDTEKQRLQIQQQQAHIEDLNKRMANYAYDIERNWTDKEFREALNTYLNVQVEAGNAYALNPTDKKHFEPTWISYEYFISDEPIASEDDYDTQMSDSVPKPNIDKMNRKEYDVTLTDDYLTTGPDVNIPPEIEQKLLAEAANMAYERANARIKRDTIYHIPKQKLFSGSSDSHVNISSSTFATMDKKFNPQINLDTGFNLYQELDWGSILQS